jgi:hypothetical protein
MKNKKAVIDELIKHLIWVVLFIILLVGVGFLLRKILI